MDHIARAAGARLLPRQYSSSNSYGSSGSGACPDCDDPTSFFVAYLSRPAMGAALAFAVICLIGFVVLFVVACTTRPFAARSGIVKRTRFGVLWALVFFVLGQLLQLVNIVISTQRKTFPSGLIIMFVFEAAFYVAGQCAAVWAIFGFLWSRFHALKPESKMARATRIIGIVALVILCLLGAIYIIIYCIYTASYLGASVGGSGALLDAFYGSSIAFDVLRLLASFAFLAFGIYLLVASRRAANFSKIPLLLLTTAIPFHILTSLADVVQDGIYNYGDGQGATGYYRYVTQEITLNLFFVIVFAGLVAAMKQHDWAAPEAAAGGAHYAGGYDAHTQQQQYYDTVPHFGHTGNPPMMQQDVNGGTAYRGPAKPELGGHAAPYPELPHNGPGSQYYNSTAGSELEGSARYQPVPSGPPTNDPNSPRRF